MATRQSPRKKQKMETGKTPSPNKRPASKLTDSVMERPGKDLPQGWRPSIRHPDCVFFGYKGVYEYDDGDSGDNNYERRERLLEERKRLFGYYAEHPEEIPERFTGGLRQSAEPEMEVLVAFKKIDWEPSSVSKRTGQDDDVAPDAVVVVESDEETIKPATPSWPRRAGGKVLCLLNRQ